MENILHFVLFIIISPLLLLVSMIGGFVVFIIGMTWILFDYHKNKDIYDIG